MITLKIELNNNGKLEVILENGSKGIINVRGITNNTDYSMDLSEERWENALERQKHNEKTTEPDNVILYSQTFKGLFSKKYDYIATCGECHYRHKFKSPGMTPSFVCPNCGTKNTAAYIIC